MRNGRASVLLSCLASFYCLASGVNATPVRSLTGLQSISFWEATGTATKFTFLANGPELAARRVNPLTGSNKDFSGLPDEHYDVFYSNADGSFNLNGEYVSIEGVFGQSLPAGGGLNLAEMVLNFSSSIEYGNYVASFVALGDNAIPGNVGNAIDSNTATATTMGNTKELSDNK